MLDRPHIQKSRQQCFVERDGAHGQQREEIIESRHEKSEIDVIIYSSNEMNHDDYNYFSPSSAMLLTVAEVPLGLN